MKLQEDEETKEDQLDFLNSRNYGHSHINNLSPTAALIKPLLEEKSNTQNVVL